MIYFDHAATGFPKSAAVINAVACAMAECGNPGRGAHEAAVKGAQLLYDCRTQLGSLLGCPSERVVLTPNTTYALNMAISGLIDGGRVIMSSLEHNSVCRPLYALKKKRKLRLNVFDVDLYDDEVTLERVRRLCRHGVSAAVITHASNVCGRILPVRSISRIVKQAGGIVILDAAQSAGHIPVSFDETGVDVICVAGHKGLGGPLGTGALALTGDCARRVKPFAYGGSGVASLEKDMPRVLPERLEAGTQNAPAFAGLAEGIRNLKADDSRLEIFCLLLDELKRMPGVILYGCPDKNTGNYVPVILFNIKGMGSDAVASALAKKGICVRSGWHCSPLAHKQLGSRGGVRISIGSGNTVDEARELLCQIAALLPAR